jgi:hypothetical protein
MQPLCCYFTLYKESFPKVLYFPKTYYHTSLYGPTVNGASVDPTSQVCSFAMLALPIVGNWKYVFSVVLNGITSMPKFIQIPPAVLEMNYADRQTWPTLYALISCTSCKERVTKESNWISCYLKLNGYCRREESYRWRTTSSREKKTSPWYILIYLSFRNKLKSINKHVEARNLVHFPSCKSVFWTSREKIFAWPQE